MFLKKVVPLVFLFVSGVWAQLEMAQCPANYEWVCVESDISQEDVTPQCSDGFLCGSYRTIIPWARMLA